MQYHLNGVQISEVPKFLVESSSVTAHAMELSVPYDAVHMPIISHELSNVTSYFYVYSPSIAEHENEDIHC